MRNCYNTFHNYRSLIRKPYEMEHGRKQKERKKEERKERKRDGEAGKEGKKEGRRKDNTKILRTEVHICA